MDPEVDGGGQPDRACRKKRRLAQFYAMQRPCSGERVGVRGCGLSEGE